MDVTEMFFSVEVDDMQRATAFYVTALGATVVFSSPGWSSLRIAGVRLGLALNPRRVAGRTGLHFAVHDLGAARLELEQVPGCVVGLPVEVAPGVVTVDVADTEGNTFTLVGCE